MTRGNGRLIRALESVLHAHERALARAVKERADLEAQLNTVLDRIVLHEREIEATKQQIAEHGGTTEP